MQSVHLGLCLLVFLLVFLYFFPFFQLCLHPISIFGYLVESTLCMYAKSLILFWLTRSIIYDWSPVILLLRMLSKSDTPRLFIRHIISKTNGLFSASFCPIFSSVRTRRYNRFQLQLVVRLMSLAAQIGWSLCTAPGAFPTQIFFFFKSALLVIVP